MPPFPATSRLLRRFYRAVFPMAMYPVMAVAVQLPTRTAGPESNSPETLSFNRDIRPILSEHCFSCHGPDSQHRKSELRLDRREDALSPAKSGRFAIIPHDTASSELLARINSTDPDDMMPPPRAHKTLSPREKALLRLWIQSGAKYEPHWAFIPPKRPEVPRISKNTPDSALNTHPVDAFVWSRLTAKNLSPSPEADRPTLIRRVTLDLTGLPPTPADLDAFLNDHRDGAYERLVDRLMTSHAYAERRAQEWLDLARYADTCGFADDGPQDIWLFRDWVVESLHRNTPFDQFTIEQLAGDMLPNPSTEQLLATGFHRNAPQAKGSTYPVEEYRIKGVVDRVNTTGKVWLGLSVGCAECHDHKFDPISQREYYAMFAVFNNVEHSGTGFAQGGPLLSLPTDEQAREIAELEAQHRAAASAGASKEAIQKLSIKLQSARSKVIQAPITRELPTPRATFIHSRGNFLHKGEQVTPGVPNLFLDRTAASPRDRLEFARWLVNGRNPLVARVAVNRFWQEHFGAGLVRTVDDFGVRGDAPSHPELLDWLACEFVESGWNMKHMHRLMVTSSIYKQSARVPDDGRDRDPDNLWLSRAARPRLQAEQIRDQALAVSGILDPRPGGRPVFPIQPDDYWRQRALKGAWKPSAGSDGHRRTLYTYWRRMALHPSLELLDAPPRTVCIARRNVANIPTQALVLLNDPIFTEAAVAFSRRLIHEFPNNPELRVRRAFSLTLAREPDTEERNRFLDFAQLQRKRFEQDASARAALLGEGTTGGAGDAERAAWTLLTGVLLNLDESIVRP